MATAQIFTSPIGSQFTSAIQSGESEDKNDFSVFISWDSNVTNFTQSDCSVNNNASIVSFEGENSVYTATVRPEADVESVITFTIAADSVNEGNPLTTQDIRVSTSFPDADAEGLVSLFSHGVSSPGGITVTPTRILILRVRDGFGANETLYKFTHAGVEQTSERVSDNFAEGAGGKIDYINGDIFIAGTGDPFSGELWRSNQDLTNIEKIFGAGISGERLHSITHTRLGITGLFESANIWVYAYGDTATRIEYSTGDAAPSTNRGIAHQADLLYLPKGSNSLTVAEIDADDNINILRETNTDAGVSLPDIAIYGDTLYALGNSAVFTLDIRPYRPMAKNTKTLIHPIIITGDTTIDCTQFAPDAHTIIFDVGFDLPSYLSINNSTITVDTSALTAPTTCFVMLKGINYVDATETGTFGFYLVILPATAPVWKSVSELTMRANSTYNLYQLVDADSIVFRSGRTQPTGSSLNDGVFTIGTASGTAEFTATKDGLESHTSIAIDVIQDAQNFRNTQFRYKVEIAGIDVSADLLNAPTISENLDPIAINETRINEAAITLSGVAKYDPNRTGNFWTANGLNAGGFQETVKVYTEHLISGVWTENLLFSGIILESSYPVDRAEFRLNCVDASHTLQNIVPRDFGDLEKWAETRETTDEVTFEGLYAPNNSLLPIQPATGQAWTDRTALSIATLENQSEGVIPANTGYLTAQDFRTAGGFVETNPILNYKTLPLSAEIELLMKQLSVGENHAYTIEIDLTGKTVDMPYILNRGNVPRNVQEIRNTLIVKDWVYDTTADRVVMLLHTPEGHLHDMIVQYSLSENAYRVLYRLPKDVKAHRIERRNSTNYYLLTSANITQDRSATETPRQSDKTALGYDSVAEGSTCRIYHFNASTRALTALVDETDDRPPQVGIQYYVGFENEFNIDEFEGIRPEYRSAFRWYNNNLYYRYATERKFGVARADTSGTTSELTDSPTLENWDHLNFAFDVGDTGTVYWGFVINSTLTLEQRTSRSTTTIWTGTAADGRYLGVQELLYNKENVYMVVPIQQIDYTTGTVTPTTSFTIEDTGLTNERVVSSVRIVGDRSLDPGQSIGVEIDWNGTISGITENELTVRGATVTSFSISGDEINLILSPLDLNRHRNITIDIARNAESVRGNEATHILLDFGASFSRSRTASAILCRVNTTGTPALETLKEYDFVNQAACSLTIYDGAVYFTESPPASQQYTTYNPDL